MVKFNVYICSEWEFDTELNTKKCLKNWSTMKKLEGVTKKQDVEPLISKSVKSEDEYL